MEEQLKWPAQARKAISAFRWIKAVCSVDAIHVSVAARRWGKVWGGVGEGEKWGGVFLLWSMHPAVQLPLAFLAAVTMPVYNRVISA